MTQTKIEITGAGRKGIEELREKANVLAEQLKPIYKLLDWQWVGENNQRRLPDVPDIVAALNELIDIAIEGNKSYCRWIGGLYFCITDNGNVELGFDLHLCYDPEFGESGGVYEAHFGQKKIDTELTEAKRKKIEIAETEREKIEELIRDAKGLAESYRRSTVVHNMEGTARLLDDLANVAEEYLKERMA